MTSLGAEGILASPTLHLIGWRRPVILLPAWAADDLPGAEVEAILAHELAHVRRHDFMVNTVQWHAELLFWFHPLYWWISSRIREEREYCCDDLATEAVSGGARDYLRSLVRLEGLRPAAPVRHALALTDGDLLRRTRRLIEQPRRRWVRGALAPVFFVAATATLCLPLLGTRTAARHSSTALMKQDLAVVEYRDVTRGGEVRSMSYMRWVGGDPR